MHAAAWVRKPLATGMPEHRGMRAHMTHVHTRACARTHQHTHTHAITHTRVRIHTQAYAEHTHTSSQHMHTQQGITQTLATRTCTPAHAGGPQSVCETRQAGGLLLDGPHGTHPGGGGALRQAAGRAGDPQGRWYGREYCVISCLGVGLGICRGSRWRGAVPCDSMLGCRCGGLQKEQVGSWGDGVRAGLGMS